MRNAWFEEGHLVRLTRDHPQHCMSVKWRGRAFDHGNPYPEKNSIGLITGVTESLYGNGQVALVVFSSHHGASWIGNGRVFEKLESELSHICSLSSIGVNSASALHMLQNCPNQLLCFDEN